MTAECETLPPPALPGYFEIFTWNGLVHWRLLSRNNRDSGQAAFPFSDRKSCEDGIALLIESISELQPQHTLTDNRWNWALLLDGEVLAKSSHSFDRRIRCAAACDWFRGTAPLAAIRDGQRVVRSPRLSRSVYDRQSALP
jgi:hypothetical protein